MSPSAPPKTLDQIAAELQGYDPQALRAEDVNAFLSRMVEPVAETEQVGIFQALDRVLAQDMVSPISVPPHDNSAMDGYAFRGAQLASGRPLALAVVGTALAGKAWQGTVHEGECLRIMTGAIMPEGLDTVVPQELVQQQADRVIVPAGVVRPGDNRRKLGEDLMAGQPALRAGERLGPAACGLLASLGLETVTVRRRLRVAYFSTGDEILSLGQAPREGAVYDSNRYTVHGLLTRLGCEVIDLGVVPDQPGELEAAFLRAAAQADAVITSGGVSVGEADHTRVMMKKLGDVVFWRIAMRPGRPMAVGRLSAAAGRGAGRFAAGPTQGETAPSGGSEPRQAGSVGAVLSAGPTQGETAPSGGSEPREAGSVGAVLFGLPGNPVAVMVTFLAFVRPALLRMMGCRPDPVPLLRAHSAEAIRKKPGRTEYQRGMVSRAPDGTLQVRTTGNQGSGVLSSMVQANGLIVLHHDQGSVAVGDELDVMMFDGVI
ncbi:molybdopterin molybdotransferase MoeA [Ramlibacter sp. 2FC]|uniref:molybdopterin molybdotransferase MoeA n=1 Tax=Ramlibacter sp. 2FC TaxID=2502188 RepID=UPI0010F97F7F|nr:molybdopterin molybdotransferase MoeA [Ramlibacter sp. 2FC]